MKTTRLGNYRYEITDNGQMVGLVSVCRCGKRSQWYQVQLASGEVLKEYASVRKAAEAAMRRTNTAAQTATVKDSTI